MVILVFDNTVNLLNELRRSQLLASFVYGTFTRMFDVSDLIILTEATSCVASVLWVRGLKNQDVDRKLLLISQLNDITRFKLLPVYTFVAFGFHVVREAKRFLFVDFLAELSSFVVMNQPHIGKAEEVDDQLYQRKYEAQFHVFLEYNLQDHDNNKCHVLQVEESVVKENWNSEQPRVSIKLYLVLIRNKSAAAHDVDFSLFELDDSFNEPG